MMVRIAVGTNKGQIENKEVKWDDLAKILTDHKQRDTKGGKYFVGGEFNGPERRESNMVSRTVLTFDVDAPTMSLADMELALEFNLGCAAVAYSTYNHTVEVPRIRIVIPLSRAVLPVEYGPLAKAVGDKLGIPLDACSYKANQAMYIPTCPDVSKAWALDVEGEPLKVGDYLNNITPIAAKHDEADDLEAMVAAQPLDIDMDTIHVYMRACSPALLTYDEWVRVGAALHHQFEGNAEGLALWHLWSADDSERYDPDSIEKKWRSFGEGSRQVTFASVIHMVKEVGGMGTVATTNANGATPLDVLLGDCAAVSDRGSYQALADRIKAMPANLLADLDRSMLAEALHKGWPKSVGIGKVDVRKSLTPTKPGGGGGLLAFADAWVYVEVPCTFHHTDLNYSIKREAFNVKYANDLVVMLNGRLPSVLVSESPDFVSVTDTMYWPGADQLFDYEGRAMLNTCRDDTVSACAVVDADGQAVIDMFLAHAAQLLPSVVEQNMLLDWLAYVLQNPGKRINWGLLLQGAQGCGKSYFSSVMQNILGANLHQLDSSAIAGRFTGWASGARMVVVEEIRISGTNKYEVLDRLKPYLTNDTIAIEEKGRDQRTVPNFTNYFLLTNHKDAIPISDGDRRYGVLFCSMQNKTQMVKAWGDKVAKGAYFRHLFDESERRIDALAHYLLNKTISPSFAAKGEAPETSAKAQMMALAVSPEREQVEDAIDKNRCAVIDDELLDITYLNQCCTMDGDEFPSGRTLSKILSELGYSKCIKRIKRKTAKREMHTVWFGSGYDDELAVNRVTQFHDDPDSVPLCDNPSFGSR